MNPYPPQSQQIPFFQGRPTQRPLNREEQKQAFATLQQGYAFSAPQIVQPDPIQYFPVQPIKEIKPTAEEQLLQYKERLSTYQLKLETAAVEKTLEETKTATTVKQFYCSHRFTPVRAKWMGLPLNYKICNLCGLVK